MIDINELKNKPIAVLGAGAVGKAISADCALAGAEVRICDLEPFAAETLFGVAENGIEFFGQQLNLYGFKRSGTAQFARVTTDVAEAVEGAGIVIITTPAVGHKPFFEKLIPALEDGMVVHIFPDNYGSLVLRKMMREAGCDKEVIVGGWSSSPYGCRVEIKGGVVLPKIRAYYRAITLRGAALPSRDQDAFLRSTEYMGCMDAVTNGEGVTGGDTVMDIGFSNVNPVLHCPGALLGVSTMENFGVFLERINTSIPSILMPSALRSLKSSTLSIRRKKLWPVLWGLGFKILPEKISSTEKISWGRNIWARTTGFPLTSRMRSSLVPDPMILNIDI